MNGINWQNRPVVPNREPQRGNGQEVGNRCKFCGQPSHVGKPCPQYTRRCYTCNKVGHISPYCPNCDKKSERESSKKAQARVFTLTSADAQASNDVIEEGITMEVELLKVDIANTYGEKLAGVLHETGSKEVVVLCHGFRSSKEHRIFLNLATAITGEGISVFRFDFAGNGESEGFFQYGNYRREADDLRAVVLYFLGQNRKIAAIAGHSKGGNIVLLYASVYHDVHTVVNMSGRFVLENGIESHLGKDFMDRVMKDGFIDAKGKSGEVEFRVTKESLMDRLSTDMLGASLSIENSCRVLTVHGSADEIIPVEDALEFAKLIPNHKLQIVEGADHGYTSHQVELTSIVLNFIKTGIQHDNTTS